MAGRSAYRMALRSRSLGSVSRLPTSGAAGRVGAGLVPFTVGLLLPTAPRAGRKTASDCSYRWPEDITMRRRMFALCHRRMWLAPCPNLAPVRGQPNLSLDALHIAHVAGPTTLLITSFSNLVVS